MPPSFTTDPLGALSLALRHTGTGLSDLFLAPTSSVSLLSLAIALILALAALLLRRPMGRRRIRLKVLVRALFPRDLIRAPSTRVDLGFMAFNLFVAGTVFGAALLSYHWVGTMTHDLLVRALGTPAPSPLGEGAGMALMTLALFLAYELGFWIDHYTSHNIPAFWEIHRVHHTATHLTPMTQFRVHPLEVVKLDNILAVVMGGTYGLVGWALGRPVAPFEVAGHNVLLLALTLLLMHLQHTRFWIPFTGVLGRLVISPAHHQIHHSDDPAHHGKNLGAFLAVFDWLFGTLHVPTPRRERLVFGVAPSSAQDQTLAGVALAPVTGALGKLLPAWPRGRLAEN